MAEGKIVKLIRHRGFGFIDVADDSDEDVFFHHSGLEDIYFEDLSVGDKLEFEIEHTDKGPEAKNISKKIEVTEFDMGNDEDESLAEESYAEEDLGW